ncbi:MAG: glucokinase [Pirellulaceae bacterium]|nr:MAG: glucokinase [Pirellulaceae bacterium]
MSGVPRVEASQAERPLFFGVDVGGTGIKIGLVDNQGRSVERTRIDTWEERGPADAVTRVRRAMDELLQKVAVGWPEVAAVGLGTPGTMDIPRGLILAPPNLPHWRNFPIRDALSDACGKPVWFANDANAAAYGEYWVGSGRDHPSMIMLTLGTGVGGGIIIEGMSVDGRHSFGSECGHIIVDSRDDARLCAWGGGRGELEAYASATAVVARTKELLEAGRESSLGRRIAREELTALMVAEEANAGDPLALEIIDETARWLGIGIVTLVHTIDPGLVVLGGAMDFGGEQAPAGRRFLEGVRQEFRRRAFDVVAHSTQIEFAQLGSDAGYIGAAGIARAGWLKTAGRSPGDRLADAPGMT